MPLVPTRRQFGALLAGATLLAAPRPPRAAGLSPITLQSTWINDPEFVGNFVAIDKGFYKQQGLDLTYLPGGPNVIPEGALLTGKAEIALTAVINCAQAVAQKGAPFKVIGTQFQKNPNSIISLEKSNIRKVEDLAGKTVAVAPLNIATFTALLALHGLKPADLKIVPYAFDPTPLGTGEVDAVADFMTSLPFIVEKKFGVKTSYFLLYDVGLELYGNLVTVTEATLKSRRPQLLGFLRASRQGWQEDFANPDKYVDACMDTWFKGNGYTRDAAIYHSHAQIPLIENPNGIFWMDDAAIEKNLESLARLGIKAPRAMFDTSLLREL